MQDNAGHFGAFFAGHWHSKMQDFAGHFARKNEKCRTMQDIFSASFQRHVLRNFGVGVGAESITVVEDKSEASNYQTGGTNRQKVQQ